MAFGVGHPVRPLNVRRDQGRPICRVGNVRWTEPELVACPGYAAVWSGGPPARLLRRRGNFSRRSFCRAALPISIASGSDNTTHAMTIPIVHHHTAPVCRTRGDSQATVLGIRSCEKAENFGADRSECGQVVFGIRTASKLRPVPYPLAGAIASISCDLRYQMVRVAMSFARYTHLLTCDRRAVPPCGSGTVNLIT